MVRAKGPGQKFDLKDLTMSKVTFKRFNVRIQWRVANTAAFLSLFAKNLIMKKISVQFLNCKCTHKKSFIYTLGSTFLQIRHKNSKTASATQKFESSSEMNSVQEFNMLSLEPMMEKCCAVSAKMGIYSFLLVIPVSDCIANGLFKSKWANQWSKIRLLFI